MSIKFKANLKATGIGSVPFINPEQACKVVFDNFKDIPFWPQMPKRSFKENMYAQYLEGMPSLVLDEEKKHLCIDTSGDISEQLAFFYEKYMEENPDCFAISQDHAAGLYAFKKYLQNNNQKYSTLKCHITGPISFLLTVTDKNKKPIMHNAELSDAALNLIQRKVQWQIKEFKDLADEIIFFLDEPYLVSIGSAFANIDNSAVISKIKYIIDTVHKCGALAGIHCCGNTDWSVLAQTDIDIVNFDAYEFGQSISLYPETVKGFLNKSGIIAWGIVPTSEVIKKCSVESLLKHFEETVALLTAKGIDKKQIVEQSLLTPSCGTGTLSEELAYNVFNTVKELSEAAQAKLLNC